MIFPNHDDKIFVKITKIQFEKRGEGVMRRLIFSILLFVFPFLILYAVNAPIQDVFFFNIRDSLREIEKVAPEAVELIEAAVAMNIDPSVALPGFGKRISVDWKPLDKITQFELAIMAVKILGKEGEVLKLYPLSSPTFEEIKTSLEKEKYRVGDLYYDRAYGYVEYYKNFLLKKYPFLMDIPFKNKFVNKKGENSPLDMPHREFVSRLDVIEFIIRLATARYPEIFGKGFGKYIPDILKSALNLNDDSTIVDFAEALNRHLRTMYGANLPENVGFLYAFEFYFLTKRPVKNGELRELAIPILFSETFRIFWNPELRKFENLGKYGDERLFQNYAKNGDDFMATRWWTVALFAKIFASVPEKAINIPAPVRELNNFVSYRLVSEDNYTGQVMFNHVICEKGKIEEVKCSGCESESNEYYPFVFLKTNDGKYYIVTDVTQFYEKRTGRMFSGEEFAKWYCEVPSACKKLEQEKKVEEMRVIKFVGIGKVVETGAGKVVLEKTMCDPNLDPLFLKFKEKIPREFLIPAEGLEDYMIFIPDSMEMPELLPKLVEMIRDGITSDEFEKLVSKRNVDLSTLVEGERIMFDVKFSIDESGYRKIAGKIVKILPAYDRLNHRNEPLTLKNVKEFVGRYRSYVDNIGGKNESPMISYYMELLKFAKENDIPDDAVLVALVKMEEDIQFKMTVYNYRKIDQILGKLRAVEILRRTGELCKTHDYKCYDVEDKLKAPECFGTSNVIHEVSGVKKNLCKKPEDKLKPVCPSTVECPENSVCGVSKGGIQWFCNVKHILSETCENVWVATFEPYVSIAFQFPLEYTKIALMKEGKVEKVTNDPSILLEDVFGFKGPAVKDFVLVRSVNPDDIFGVDGVILKAFEQPAKSEGE